MLSCTKVDLVRGQEPLDDRFPFLEFETLLDLGHQVPGLRGRLAETVMSWRTWWHGLRLAQPRSWLGYRDTVHLLEAADQRRFIKSHLPFSLLPPALLHQGKVVYVARNARDAMVSSYHHHRLIKGHDYVGDLPTFAKRFMKDQLMLGSFFNHLEEAWKVKEYPNILFIWFEDMKKDLRSVIKKVCNFLDCSLTKEEMERLLNHLDFKNFKNNPAVNREDAKDFGFMRKDGNFVRKGTVGSWKEEFKDHPEMEAEFNSWLDTKIDQSNVIFPVK